jgi:hypothetical protein
MRPLKKHSLSPADMSLYRRHGKHVLLKVRCNKSVGYIDNAIGLTAGLITYPSKCVHIKYIAGDWSESPEIHYHSPVGWRVTRASKSDLLLYLDRVVDSKLATKILRYSCSPIVKVHTHIRAFRFILICGRFYILG